MAMPLWYMRDVPSLPSRTLGRRRDNLPDLPDVSDVSGCVRRRL